MSRSNKTSARPTYAHVDEKTAERGWFQAQLWAMEAAMWGRWSYWLAMGLNRRVGELPDWAIPQIPFQIRRDVHQPPTELSHLPADMLEKIGGGSAAYKHALKVICERCRYHGAHLIDIVHWWLWAFGSNTPQERPRVHEEVAVILYHEFELHRLLGNPADWGAEITSEWVNGGKAGTGWFPTPISLITMMTQMTFGNHPGVDQRLLTVNDPCVGTGGFMLGVSNYSLRLSCMDVDPLMTAWTEFAGWLFIPWLVYPQYVRELRDRAETAERVPSSTTVELKPQTQVPVQVGQLDLFAGVGGAE